MNRTTKRTTYWSNLARKAAQGTALALLGGLLSGMAYAQTVLIDFSSGVRGKFFRPNLRLRTPIYFDDETQRYLVDRAKAKGVDVASLVNQLLKKDIELIEAAR